MRNNSAAAEERSNVVPLRRQGTRRSSAPVTISERPMVTITTITVLGKTRQHSFGLRPAVRLLADQAPAALSNLLKYGAISYDARGELFIQLPVSQRWNQGYVQQLLADAKAVLKKTVQKR